MPLFTPDEQERFDNLLGRGAPPPGASVKEQLARGFVSGLTFDMVKPYKDAGKGGLPETLANLAGNVVSFAPLARGAGLGVAAAGKMFPSLLKATETGGRIAASEAASKLFPKILGGTGKHFYPYPEALSTAGRIGTFGVAAGAGAIAPDVLGDEPTNSVDMVKKGLLGAALGMGGEALAGRLARGKITPPANVTPTAADAVPSVIREPMLAAVAKLIAQKEDEIVAATAKLEIAGSVKEKKLAAKALEKLVKQKEHFQERFDALGGRAEVAAIGPAAVASRGADPLFDAGGRTIDNIPQIDQYTGTPLQHITGFLGAVRGPSSLSEELASSPGYPGMANPIIEPPGVTTALTGAIPEMGSGGITGTAAEILAPPRINLGKPPIPDDLKALPIDVVKMRLRGYGQSVGNLPDHRLREMLATYDRRLAIQAPAKMVDEYGGEVGSPFAKAVTPEQKKIVEALRVSPETRAEVIQQTEKAVAELEPDKLKAYLQSIGVDPRKLERMSIAQIRAAVLANKVKDIPTTDILRAKFTVPDTPPGATPMPANLFTVINPIKAGTTPVLDEISNTVRVPLQNFDAKLYDNGVIMLETGKRSKLPSHLKLQVDVGERHPFMDINWGCPELGSRCAYGNAQYLLGDGWTRKKVAQFVGKAGWLPPSLVLMGSGSDEAARLVPVLDGIDASVGAIKNAVYSLLPNVSKWAPETKAKVKDVFNRHFTSSPEEFRAAVEREVPEAATTLPELQEMFERIWLQYVADGVVDPSKRIVNYFPRYRERLKAVASGELQVEAGDGYIPIPIEDLVKPRLPWSVRGRKLDDPDMFPKNMSFDDIMDIYATQYARHSAIRQAMPELQDVLKAVPEDYKAYAADIVNYWMGNDAVAKNMSEFGAYIRQYQFARTIGGSLLSPIVNAMQKINTFAVVSPKAFMQAFDDMHDPNRLRYAIQAGISGGLEKAGVDLIGPPSQLSSKIVQKLGGMFQATETSNRLHAFFAGMREAESRGLVSLNEQMEFGRKVMNDTQFIMGRANVIPKARGDWGRTLAQFQSFRINQTHFMLRLADEAVDGIKNGQYDRVLPFIKFWGPTIALGGLSSTPLGFLMEDRSIKEALGGDQWAAAAAGGLPETLLGLSLGHQLGLGSIGAEDLQSFVFYIPGPSVGFVQGAIGAALGVSAGRGLDLSQVGRQLSFDERVRLMTQLAPAGIQASRISQFMKLINTDGKYREALDWPSAIGWPGAAAQGDLLSSKAADLGQILGAGVGFMSADREKERDILTKQKRMIADYDAAMNEAAGYYVAGQSKDAMNVIHKFNKKYADVVGFAPITGVSQQSIRAAGKRRVEPPGKRVRPPMALRTAEPFLEELDFE